MIHLKNIEIGYDQPILSNDELYLNNGQAYVLIGRNGSGKTTFLKSILGETKLLHGTISIDGKVLTSIRPQDRSKKIAFVSSTFPTTSFVKAEDYVALGRSPFTNAFGRLTQEDREIIDGSFQTLGIEHLKKKFTTDLSDGEKQLVAIAKALAQQTPHIFLDEPLAFLDYTNRKLVLDKINHLVKDMNKCILLSSHDIDITLDYAFNYILIDKKSKTLIDGGNKLTKSDIVDCCF